LGSDGLGHLLQADRAWHFRAPKRRGLGEIKVEVEAAELMLILEGIDLAGARRRQRWEPKKKLENSVTAQR
jgi:hypothetical protein